MTYRMQRQATRVAPIGILICVSVIVGLAIWCAFLPHLRVIQTERTILQVADACHEFAMRNGRIPQDSRELCAFLGRQALPKSGWGQEIEYRPDPEAKDHFWINAVSPPPQLTIYEYDSNDRERKVDSFPF